MANARRGHARRADCGVPSGEWHFRVRPPRASRREWKPIRRCAGGHPPQPAPPRQRAPRGPHHRTCPRMRSQRVAASRPMTGGVNRGCAGCCTSPPQCQVRPRSGVLRRGVAARHGSRWALRCGSLRPARRRRHGPARGHPGAPRDLPRRRCRAQRRGRPAPLHRTRAPRLPPVWTCSSMAFCRFAATTARSSASCRCRAKAARSAPVAGGGAWPSGRRISSRQSCPGSRSGNGSSPSPTVRA